MEETVRSIYLKGLKGEYTHINPIKLLEDLSPETARRVPKGFKHSCWDLLHHMVAWQELTIKALQDDSATWESLGLTYWPDKNELGVEEYETVFTDLVKKFLDGLGHMEKLIQSVDYKKSVPGIADSPAAHVILVLLQHNSYHLGQIVTTREALGDWPPPK